MTTIIIGAGASGLACAIRLKQNIPDSEVIVLERLDKPGKKILATGNGRCNLTNTNAENSDTVLSFFNDLGLVTKADDEGRVYPYSNQASTVLDTLLDACAELGVEIITDCTVEGIDSDLSISTSQGIFMADNIVIATGGTALAACNLVRKVGAEVVGMAFVIELADLNGRAKMPQDVEVVSMLVY